MRLIYGRNEGISIVKKWCEVVCRSVGVMSEGTLIVKKLVV